MIHRAGERRLSAIALRGCGELVSTMVALGLDPRATVERVLAVSAAVPIGHVAEDLRAFVTGARILTVTLDLPGAPRELAERAVATGLRTAAAAVVP